MIGSRFVKKNWDVDKKSAEELVYNSKLKTLFFCSLQVTITSLFVLLCRFVFGLSMEGFWVLIVYALWFVLVAVIIWKTRSLFWAGILFHGALSIIIPSRVLVTGGAYAPLVFTYLSHAVLVFSVYGAKWGVLTSIYGALSVFAIGYLQAFYSFDFGGVNDAIYFNAVNISSILCYIALPVFFLIAQKDEIKNAVLKYEEKQSSFLIMRRLNHEIGNSLNIALGFLEISKEEKNKELVKVVKKSVLDIQAMIREMSKSAGRGELVDVLEKNKESVAIIEELRKSAGLDTGKTGAGTPTP